jgi:ABC-2 type transport system ATP-binding protein
LKSNFSHISIDSVSKQYSPNLPFSLDKINLQIQSNTKFGILGPNGAGKTTLISILTGLIEPTSGKVNYVLNNGDSIHGIDLKASIGFVPQDFAFYPELTPLQNLHYFGALSGLSKLEIKVRSEYTLEVLGLTSVAKKKAHTFSGGMKRRLNLAIGIIHEPAILFLDEPTVGVDVQSKFAIIQLLEKLNKEHTTIIYTSHHLSEAQDFCTDIAMIDQGTIICTNQTSKLLEEYHSKNLEELFIKLTGQALRD